MTHPPGTPQPAPQPKPRRADRSRTLLQLRLGFPARTAGHPSRCRLDRRCLRWGGVMKTAQYVRQEKAIAAADSGGIRERWLWGLRLLRDPEAYAPGSSQLKPGRADELINAAKAAGRKLNAREIRYRLQCARTYKTESEIRQASAEFGSWSALIEADFPAFEVPEGEPPADHRTDDERKRDHARALVEAIGEQGVLFPLSDFEPVETSLKDLVIYTEEQEGMTSRFVKVGKRRREYLNKLIEAANFDLSMTWQEAHARLGGEPL